MFERRIAGEPGPWTDDPILREFKICYHDEPGTDEDRLFQITAFRTFSKTATWRTIRDILGRHPTLDDLADGAFTNALDQARQRNGGLYTGAFILCATDAYGQSSKHRNHVELFRHMFLHDQLGYELLHGYPLMGGLQRERVHPGRAGRAARHQEVLRRPGRLHPRPRPCSGVGPCTPSTARACSARPTNTAAKPPPN
jgi:hypothetical protein